MKTGLVEQVNVFRKNRIKTPLLKNDDTDDRKTQGFGRSRIKTLLPNDPPQTNPKSGNV